MQNLLGMAFDTPEANRYEEKLGMQERLHDLAKAGAQATFETAHHVRVEATRAAAAAQDAMDRMEVDIPKTLPREVPSPVAGSISMSCGRGPMPPLEIEKNRQS